MGMRPVNSGDGEDFSVVENEAGPQNGAGQPGQVRGWI